MKNTSPLLSVKWIAFCLLLFPFSSFAQDATWFKDVSDSLGFKIVHGGAIVGLDVNNDGYPDLLVLNGNAVSNGYKLYINEQRQGSGNPKDRVFVDSTAHSGLNIPGIFKDMCSAGDFNNDGNVDIITNCWYMNYYVDGNYCYPSTDEDSCRLHLFLGDGHGHFAMKQNSGLEAIGAMAGSGLPTLDYDLDGNLDVYVCTHLNNWCQDQAEAHYLLKGNGDGTFTNVTTAAGLNGTPLALFGGNMADWNNDGYPDIITAPYESFGLGNLYQNNGNGTFTDVASAKGYNPHWMTGDHSGKYNPNMVPWAAMPCDYDNDGDIDFLVPLVHGAAAAGDGRTSIFTNNGAASGYTLTPDVNRITRHSPQNFDFGDHNAMWIDFDHDMLADLMIGDAAYDLTSYGDTDMQRMFFCLQDQSHHFDDITQKLGFISGPYAANISDRIRRPSVMMPMDYDMDGDDDIFKCAYNGDDSLNFLVLRNDVANKKHYIEIKLVAPPGVNKSCIGARIVVKSGGVTQMREIYGGQGQWTTEWPFVVNFGLNDNTTVDSIDVRWPNKTFSHIVLKNIPADTLLTISGAGTPTGIAPVGTENGFVVYPNPVSVGMLTVGFKNTTEAAVNVYNALGQQVYSYITPAGTDRVEIPAQNFQPGAYWIHVNGKNNSINETKSFIKF